MSVSTVIKSSGFRTKRIDTNTFKGVFGGNCTFVVGMFNKEDKILCYEGKPYFPCGRLKAFAALIQGDQLAAKCFSFELYSN